ncbi:MAG: DNA polymerase III subunit delta [Cyclobacteriaceae bacterium]|nr:DNA polymerase III subunit delta [Cyclobacteriaceae bacterium]
MRFSDIIGFEETKSRLVQSVKKDHLAHALLFSGKPGNPGLALALAFSSYLNCEESEGKDDACGHCASCLKNAKFIHPDLNFVFPVSSTKTITGKDVISKNYLKDWRKFLAENPYGHASEWAGYFGGENKSLNISKEESRNIISALSLSAFEGRYKIMLIWLPEYLHPFAANGLLKILEEPTVRTIFLLVSNDKERLLGTILSRTQHINIRQFNDEELAKLIVEKTGLDNDKAASLARLADGDLSHALRLQDNLDADNNVLFRDWMRACYTWDMATLVQRADDFHKMSKVGQRGLLTFAQGVLRESLISVAGVSELQRSGAGDIEFIRKFSSVLDTAKIDRMTSLVDEAWYHLDRNASPKITFLDLSLQLASIVKK